MTLRFTTLGHPQPQGSKTGFVNPATGRVVLQEAKKGRARADWRSWREAVRSEAQHAVTGIPGYPLCGPVAVHITFGLPRTASTPKRKRTWPIKARSGDVDKLARCALDSLTGVVFGDDAQVVDLHVEKDWAGQPGATITVTGIDAGSEPTSEET